MRTNLYPQPLSPASLAPRSAHAHPQPLPAESRHDIVQRQHLPHRPAPHRWTTRLYLVLNLVLVRDHMPCDEYETQACAALSDVTSHPAGIT